MKKQTYITFILCVVCLTSCYKDSEIVINETVSEEQPNIIINTAIVGKVISDDQTATFPDNTSLVINDENFDVNPEYFSVKLNQVEKTGQSIFVYQDEELVAFAHTMLLENDYNYLDIKNFPKWNSIDYKSDQNVYSIDNIGSLDLTYSLPSDPDGLDVDSYKFLSGYMNDDELVKQLGYHAFNENNILLTMEGREAFYFSIQDEAKKELDISNSDAELTLEKSYSNNTALFYFDMDKDQWIKQVDVEGVSKISIEQNGFYMIAKYDIGTIVEGSFIYEASPVAYQEYQIINSEYKISGISTAKGRWISVTPSLMEFDLNLISPCDEILFTTDLGVQEVYDIKEITMEETSVDFYFYNLETTILDCNGMPSEDGAVVISDEDDEGRVLVFEDGAIDAFVSMCSDQFDVSTYNLETNIESESISWDLEYDQGLDYLLECGSDEGYSYIQLTRDGKEESKVYESFVMTTNGDQTILSSPNGEFKFLFKGLQEGVYPEDQINIVIDDPSFGEFGYEMSCENSTQGCGIKECFVSHYDIDNEGIIRLTFSGTLWMSTIEPRLAGEFPVEGIIIVM